MLQIIENPKTFLEVMVNLERAINEAYKIAENEFLHVGICEESHKWYQNKKLLEAMSDIKCAIDSNLPIHYTKM